MPYSQPAPTVQPLCHWVCEPKPVDGGSTSVTDTVGVATGSGGQTHWANGWTVGAGWEYGITRNWIVGLEYNYAAFTSQTYQLGGTSGNYSFDAKPRDLQWAVVRASYKFDADTPKLDGFRMAIGVDYIADRPGDAAPGGYTVASTPANPIPNQPSFYLPARTLTNLIFAYDSKNHWTVQLNVDNLFDEEYMMASINRSMIYVGTPTNFRGTFTYKF